MTDYKKYSLENLENWLYDAMSCGDATPQEIYDTIIKVVKDEYYTYKKRASESYELLALLNGNGQSYEDVMKEKEYYEPSMPPWGHSDLEALSDYFPHPNQPVYTEEELNAMCEAAASDQEKEKCREYNLRESEYYNKKDLVTRWVLPVQVDGLTGDCFVQFPDDLLERAGLKEGDMVHWIDRKDGSFEMRKVNGTK